MFLQTFSPQSPFLQPDETRLKHSFASSLVFHYPFPRHTCSFVSHEGLSTVPFIPTWLPAGKQQHATTGGWVDAPPSRAPAPAALLDCHRSPPSPFDHSRRSSPFQHTPLGSPGTESVLENWLWQCSKI